jgi:hypothetical protein
MKMDLFDFNTVLLKKLFFLKMHLYDFTYVRT